MAREFDEKRDFVRITVDCSLTYRAPDADEVEYGQAKNLSGRGMMFIAGHDIPVDSELEVTISPEQPVTQPLHALVRVVRVAKQRRGDGFEVGAVIQSVLD